jgi:ribose/xylose/arabinose/galactoside ABC-type transport system permease subunit
MAGIGAGIASGLANGLLISWLRIVPFIVTLGTMSVFLGLAKLVAEETTVRPALEQVPAWIPALVEPVPEPRWLLVSSGVWIALGLALVLAVVLRYTVFGRYVFALGSNESTARLCGVNVPLMKTAVYTLAGLFVGIAGVYQFARLSSGDPTSGIGQELKVIAAVVIGGASLNGGKGTVLGTLAGAAMMGVIASGCNTVLGVSNPMQNILIGLIIVAAAALDQIRERRLAS